MPDGKKRERDLAFQSLEARFGVPAALAPCDAREGMRQGSEGRAGVRRGGEAGGKGKGDRDGKGPGKHCPCGCGCWESKSDFGWD